MHVNRACFVQVDESRLLMLGGSANPMGKVEYNIASDTWAILPDLPFSMQNGACITIDMPGIHNRWIMITRMDKVTIREISFALPTEDCFDYGMDLQGITVMDTVTGVENTEDCQLVCQAWKHVMDEQSKLFQIDISLFRQP